MDNNLIAASWIGLALLAGLISFRTGISASLLEIVVGVAAGNFLGLFTTPFVDFIAGFGSILLTFLAGAEVDPRVLRSKFKESFLIGFFSFLVPSWLHFPSPTLSPGGTCERRRSLAWLCPLLQWQWYTP